MRIGICAALLALMVGCKGYTDLGDCVGLDDEAERDPKLVYKLSVRNLFWGIIGVETIIAPIVVATDMIYCPVARRP